MTLSKRFFSQMFAPSKRIAHFGQDVWSIFSPMALHCQAVNLGQGFPNFETPQFVKEAACEAITTHNLNQYSPPKGMPRLRTALSAEYSPLFGRALNAESEIIVTAGANEGMYSGFQAFLDEGSEVICFEPFFDQYAPNIKIAMSGGKMVYCPLRVRAGQNISTLQSSDWYIDMEEFESKITRNTRMVVLNTPHNPVGKVFNREELEQIAKICIKHNLMVISDEVYERLVYRGAEHVRIATLPGMWERTITVGSAGKSFCVTGWRVGWLIGPAELIMRSLIAHSRIVFCTNAPLQQAIAISLEKTKENGFFEEQLKSYQEKRDFMVSIFKDIGLQATVPDGSYFILVNIDRLRVDESELDECEAVEAKFCLDDKVPPRSHDWKICRWLTVKIGVAAIPPSEFYGPENAHLAAKYARFCFCKTTETLLAAKERLQKLRQYIKND